MPRRFIAAIKVAISSIFVSTMLLAPSAFAATGTASGLVNEITSHNPDEATGWDSDWDYVTLDGVDTLEGCGTSGGYVRFVIADNARGERHLRMLISAMLARKSVTISANDANENSSGYCYIRTLKIN